MKFSTSIALEPTNDIKFFTPGIMEDVTLKSVEVKSTPTGIKYIAFTFSKEGYKDLEYSQYVPNRGPNDIDDSAMNTKKVNQIKRFDKILRLFYPNPTDRLFETEDYIDYLNWLCEKLMSVDKSNLLRLKLVYDEKGYLTLPRYLKYEFVELMSTEARKVEILSFDQITKVIVADKEKEEPAASTTDAEKDDDLPF